MVYDDYADIGIFAKWVMDAPEIGGAGTSIGGKKMSLHEKGDQTRALNHNSNLQTVFVWTFSNSQTFANFTSEICRRGLLSFREYRAVSSAFRIGTDEKEPSFMNRLSVP